MSKPVIIHVNQHHIKHNAKVEPIYRQPVLTIKKGQSNTYCNEVVCYGKITFKYRPDDPLSCGAKVWAELDGLMFYPDGSMSYAEAKEIKTKCDLESCIDPAVQDAGC